MSCCCWRRWRRRRWRNTSPADLNVFYHNIWLFFSSPVRKTFDYWRGDDVSFISFIRVVFIVVVLLFHGRDRNPSFSLLCALKFHGLLKGWLPRSTRFSKRQKSRRSSSSCSFLSSSDYYGSTHGRERRSGKFDTRGFSTTTIGYQCYQRMDWMLLLIFFYFLFFFFRKETKKKNKTS